MALAILWAGLIGAGLGLDRSLRDLGAGWAACGAFAAAGAAAGVELQLVEIAGGRWFWPLTLAACTVAIGKYLATTRERESARRPIEPKLAMAAAAALGLAMGLGAHRFVGVAVLIILYTLGWRLLEDDRTASVPAAAQSSPRVVSLDAPARAVGGTEEGRHDDESGDKREEQGNGEQLAHAGGAGVAGQA